MANAAIGSGVLAFPFAYAQAGWVMGALITIFCGFLLSISMCVLVKAARTHNASTYQVRASRVHQNTYKYQWYIIFTFSVGYSIHIRVDFEP